MNIEQDWAKGDQWECPDKLDGTYMERDKDQQDKHQDENKT